jgi:phage shock protein A
LRARKDAAESAMADPVRDGKYAIEDSQKEVAEFRKKIANLMASNNRLEREQKSAEADVSKWQKVAEAAAVAGVESDVAEAVQRKSEASSKATTLDKQLQQNEKVEEQLRAQLKKADQKIQTAKSDHTRLSAQLEGAEMRKDMAKTAADFGEGGALSELDNLKDKVEEEECEAEAMEEMAAMGGESLAEKYDSSNADTSDEVAALMAKHKKT